MSKRKKRWFEAIESKPNYLYRDAAGGCLLALIAAVLLLAAVGVLGAYLSPKASQIVRVLKVR